MRAHFPLICVALLFSVSDYGQNVGDITTVAGSSTGGFAGDGGLSISAKIYQAYGVGLDKAGNFYIADTGNNRIRKVNIANYIITTVAGNGKLGFCGDGGPATNACLSQPTGWRWIAPAIFTSPTMATTASGGWIPAVGPQFHDWTSLDPRHRHGEVANLNSGDLR